jgi:subtilisin family serine protease
VRAGAALAAILALTLTSGRAQAEPAGPAAGAVSVIVTLQDQASLTAVGGGTHAARGRKAVTKLRVKADSTQGPIRAFLAKRRAQGRVFAVQRFWVFNGLAVTATPDVVADLATRPDVASVRPNATLAAPAPVTTSTSAEANISLVGAPLLWQLGIRGQGIVVGSMDTGVDATHPDLAAQWRGGTNSWYDPNGQHPTEPFDANGHGTSTMGVMVGGAAGGTGVGMAPDAQWVAVKIFNDNGVATVSGIHAGFQWLLDPDGDPSTADAPDVVNNSWTFQTPSCDLEFEPDLEALRAAGIVPVFAAGNSGPGETTSMSPANNPGALAVGATTEADAVFSLSSRGPSSCGEAETVYPDLVAPGVDVRTTDLGGGYRSLSGTSLAAPHAAGALALLLSAFPDLAADAQEASLLGSATDLGPAGPDNAFGYGRLDVLAAYEQLGMQPPGNATRPLLIGTFALGGTVDIVQGTWNAPGPITLSDLLQRCDAAGENCVDIAGMGANYLLTTEDVDHTLRVVETASNVYGDRSATSDPSPLVSDSPSPPHNVVKPSISGVFRVGSMLTGLDGERTGTPPINFARQWVRCAPGPCTPIAGATDSTYTLVADDINHRLRFRVTATNSGGSRTSRSPLSPKVLPAAAGGALLALSPAGTAGGLSFADEDIVSFDGQSFALRFDGSDVGLADVGIDAFARIGPKTFLLSLDRSKRIGRRLVQPSDVLRFDATSVGEDTSGRFSLFFDGSDVGLRGEDVDSVQWRKGRLLISTKGRVRLPGITATGSDILAFRPASLGARTAGRWSLYLDGSDVGLSGRREDIDAAWVAPTGEIYLSTRGRFSVPGLAGSKADAFVCVPSSLGSRTRCRFLPALDGGALGLGRNNLVGLKG